MTAHVRTELRNAVAILIDGITAYSLQVFTNRGYPLSSSELPCAIISTGDEDIEILTANYPAQQLRTESLIISVIVESIGDIDDILDAICVEIESALAGNVTIARNFRLLSTSGIEPSVVGEKPVCLVEMRFLADMITLENAPDQAL